MIPAWSSSKWNWWRLQAILKQSMCFLGQGQVHEKERLPAFLGSTAQEPSKARVLTEPNDHSCMLPISVFDAVLASFNT
eukprot:scaffold57019_cov15-Tisochrysis_lutea.AAC.2